MDVRSGLRLEGGSNMDNNCWEASDAVLAGDSPFGIGGGSNIPSSDAVLELEFAFALAEREEEDSNDSSLSTLFVVSVKESRESGTALAMALNAAISSFLSAVLDLLKGAAADTEAGATVDFSCRCCLDRRGCFSFSSWPGGGANRL